MNDLLNKIHGYDIYSKFIYKDYPIKFIGWNVNPSLYRKLINETQPKLIIELGSWYGASAICMGNTVKELGLSTKIVCIDTWLGSYEFIGLHEKDHERQLMPKFGYPNAYYQFLANVCHYNMQDIIIPFPQTIRLACKWIASQKILADLIYIDGNNDIFDVYNDINEAWKILEIQGTIFGDDYDNPHWPAINLGLNKFCTENLIRPTIFPKFPNHWSLNKKYVN